MEYNKISYAKKNKTPHSALRYGVSVISPYYPHLLLKGLGTLSIRLSAEILVSLFTFESHVNKEGVSKLIPFSRQVGNVVGILYAHN
jgi:hypothetical protein